MIPPIGLLAALAGAIAGAGLFLLLVALRGLPSRPPGQPGRLRGWARARMRITWSRLFIAKHRCATKKSSGPRLSDTARLW